MRDLIRSTRLSLSELQDRTGISIPYLKQLSAGNRNAGPDVAPKLAPMFRERAAELREEAPRTAARMLADADALEAAAATLDPPVPPVDDPPPNL
ncbi:hypothetical protein [Longimicrobium sp.]|uniref:hypothetical protein n=1 Tax=Longimicrobium sp. TaxID=2029185 RepID=UPI002F955A51